MCRCEEIMLEKLILVRESEQWQLLAERSTSQLVADFGSQAQAILEACLTGDAPSRNIPLACGLWKSCVLHRRKAYIGDVEAYM